MRIYDVIKDKRDNKELSKEQIDFWINGIVNGEIVDYQSSALLMAIVLNGMTDSETFYLTDAMARSGDMLDLSRYGTKSADKHSSGGVGDSTTFIVIPVLASLGFVCAKMSGRGLGHTGGTIDKIESVSGVNTSIQRDKFFEQADTVGAVIAGQSENLCPADKILYALRDVTATVDSIPLIASSIMSKKLASGAYNIVLDVKCGKGAFMKNRQDAKKLARLMTQIGKKAGRNVTALITDMDRPLSRYIGNYLEVAGAVEVLKGNLDCDLYKVAKQLCMCIAGEEYSQKIDECVLSGNALNKFIDIIKAQGGYGFDFGDINKSKYSLQIKSDKEGIVADIDAMKIADVVLKLGGGRNKKQDKILPYVGVVLNVNCGEKVQQGGLLATMYYDRENDEKMGEEVLKAFEIGADYCNNTPLIIDKIM